MKNRDNTAVDATCSYRNDPAARQFDRVKVYRKLSSMTKDITKLGHYSLDNRSLYVNGNQMIVFHLLVVLSQHFA